MKTNSNKRSKPRGFTIAELLTVMAVIVLLMSMLVPALNKARKYAKEVKQKNQFHAIDVAIELYNAKLEGYPDSDRLGAMQLCEALMGPDYRVNQKPEEPEQLLRDENAGAYMLQCVLPQGGSLPPFPPDLEPFLEQFVLCDVFATTIYNNPGNNTDPLNGKRVGMPILYYKARSGKNSHDLGNPNNTDNIYNYLDNHTIASTYVTAGKRHALGLPVRFYELTRNEKLAGVLDAGGNPISKPYRADSYILISAGFDGEYGTKDDVFNFME